MKILSRFDERVIYECEADTMLGTLQKAVKSGANLTWANLTWANLGGANLGGANLTGVNLGGANLGGANLGGKPILNIVQCSGIGSERRTTVAIILTDSIQIQCGCFTGTLDEFAAQIETTHATNQRYLAEYRAAVAWITACAEACRAMKGEVKP